MVKKKDQEKLQAKAEYCTEEILKAKNDQILRKTLKILNDTKKVIILKRYHRY